MANLDTRSKRASSVGILLVWFLAPPLPDGTISQGDRQHIAWSYSGIAATVVSAPTGEIIYIFGTVDSTKALSGYVASTDTVFGTVASTATWIGNA